MFERFTTWSVSLIERLHRQRDALVEPGVGQGLLHLVGALGRVLRALHRQRLRKSGGPLLRGHVLREIEIARQNAEVRVAAEHEVDAVLGKPVRLAVEPIHVVLVHLAGGRRAPVAERARERTAAIRFPERDPLLIGMGAHQRIEHARQVRRRHDVEIGQPRPFRVLDEAALRVAIGDAGRRRATRRCRVPPADAAPRARLRRRPRRRRTGARRGSSRPPRESAARRR